MKSLAASWHQAEMFLRAAEVKIRSGEEYIVLLNHRPERARRAAGCLLEPEAGDVVLTAGPAEAGLVYILAVLARGEMETEARISTPGAIMSLGGERLTIRTTRELSIATPALSLRAGTGEARIDACTLHGETLENRFRKISTVARAIETVCERLVARLDRSYRFVRDFEETRMGRMRTIVEGLFSLAAKNASVRAEKRLKMDAEKIHLG